MKPTLSCKAAHLLITNSRETLTLTPLLSLVPLPLCPALTQMTSVRFSIIATRIWRVKTSPYLIPAVESIAVPLTNLRSTMNNSNHQGGAAVQTTVITRVGRHLLDTAKTSMHEECFMSTIWTSPTASVTRISASVTNRSIPSVTPLLWTRSRLTSSKKRNCKVRMLHLTMH